MNNHGYVEVFTDPNMKHLIAIAIQNEKNTSSEIVELVDFVLDNSKEDWEDDLRKLKNGEEVWVGGGARPRFLLKPIFQAHVIE